MTTPNEPAQDPLVGRVLGGKFKVEGLVARGGMGAVYRAIQAPFGRRCALKVLRPRVEDEARYEFQRRFLLEASTVAKLTHPNTVTVFDYGRTDDDVFFLAMEYLEGRSLASALRAEGPFPQERAIEITRGIARSLREAHSLGVVHRDIKPANVFLTRHDDEDDFVKVIDFGLVKDVAKGGDDEQTQAGIFMGSPRYMSPEQIKGDAVDGRTDVYSLGVVLFEMLAGRVPFDKSSSMNTLMAHVNEPPPSVRDLNPASDVTPAIEQVIQRALAKRPEDRFASMGDLLAALKEATGFSPAMTISDHHVASTSAAHIMLAHDSGAMPLPSLSPPAPPPPVEAPRARPWLAISAAVALVAVVAGFSMKGQPAPAAAPPQATTPATTPAAVTSVPEPQPAPEPPRATVQERSIVLTSDPPGARVRRGEQGPELCASTPCTVTLRGDDAKEGAELTLHMSKSGYTSQTLSYRVGNEAPRTLKLRSSGRAPKETPGTPTSYRKDPYENPPY